MTGPSRQPTAGPVFLLPCTPGRCTLERYPIRRRTIDNKLLIAFSDYIKRFYDHEAEELSKFGVTGSHLKTIHYLSDHDGCIQQDIVVASALSRSTISESLSQMEKLGLIERLADKDDRRITLIFLTAKGRSICAGIQETFRHYCDNALAGLSPSESTTFYRCMEKIVSRIHNSS